MTTQDTAGELRRLLAEASPGPWRYHDMEAHTIVHGKPGREIICAHREQAYEPRTANCDLVIAAVNALPGLLDASDERDRLRAALERIGAIANSGSKSRPEGQCMRTMEVNGLVRERMREVRLMVAEALGGGARKEETNGTP